MHKSSLLEILKTFTPKELIKFEDFVNSPYFNRNKNVISLFTEIKKYAQEFNDDNLRKEAVWKKLFPDKEFNYGIMKNLIFDLSKLISDFIGQENYSTKKTDVSINILEQYQSRGLYKLYEKKLDDCKKELGRSEVNTENYFYNLLISKIELNYLILKHNLKDFNKFDFKILNNYLTLFYYSNYFKLNYTSLQISFLYNLPFDKIHADRMIKSYRESDHKDDFTDMMFNIFMTVYEPFNEDNYYRLKELFYKNIDKLSKTDQYNYSMALLNFCKNNSNSGNLFFIKERYQYNKIIAEKELFYHNNIRHLDRLMFMSIVMAGTTAGEFEWAESFIKKYKSSLAEDVRDQAVNFAYTNYYFKRKEFEKALDYLSKCTKAVGMDKINIKTYQFFLYYELGYYEELKNLADTSRHFSKNDKTISAHSQKEFINFVNIVNRLSEYKYNLENGTADDYLLTDIKIFLSENVCSGKNWFKEKIEELQKSKS